MRSVYIWLMALLLTGCFSKKPPEMQTDLKRLNNYINLDSLQPAAAKWAWYGRGHQSMFSLGPSDYAFMAVLTLPEDIVRHLQDTIQRREMPGHLDSWDARDWLPMSVTNVLIKQDNGYRVDTVYPADDLVRGHSSSGFFFVTAGSEICIVLYEAP